MFSKMEDTIQYFGEYSVLLGVFSTVVGFQYGGGMSLKWVVPHAPENPNTTNR